MPLKDALARREFDKEWHRRRRLHPPELTAAQIKKRLAQLGLGPIHPVVESLDDPAIRREAENSGHIIA